MKTYLVKFKSGTQVIVKDKDLSEATQKLGEIDHLQMTDIQIFESDTQPVKTNPFGYDEFYASLEDFRKKFEDKKEEPKLVAIESPTIKP